MLLLTLIFFTFFRFSNRWIIWFLYWTRRFSIYNYMPVMSSRRSSFTKGTRILAWVTASTMHSTVAPWDLCYRK